MQLRSHGAAAEVAAAMLAPGVATAQAAAEIVSLEGKGEYREAGATSWRPAAARQKLFPTNYVRTLDLSRMALVFPDRTTIRLGPNSEAEIREVASASSGRTLIHQNKGKSWTQSKSPPRSLEIRTPSALAAIRGTDWEIAIDEGGRSTVSVFSGEVELSNELGSVTIGPNEQAEARPGQAPVKLALVVSRDRIQWVSSLTIDPSRHPGEDLGAAYARLRALAMPDAAQALLLADIELYRGDVAAARAALQSASQRFPGDERLEAGLGRASLFSGDLDDAAARAGRALQRRRSADSLLLLGDAERRRGRAAEAMQAYAEAVTLSPGEARAWHGLGVVEAER